MKTLASCVAAPRRGRPRTTGSSSWPHIRARLAPEVLEALKRDACDAGRSVSAHVARVLADSVRGR